VLRGTTPLETLIVARRPGELAYFWWFTILTKLKDQYSISLSLHGPIVINGPSPLETLKLRRFPKRPGGHGWGGSVT